MLQNTWARNGHRAYFVWRIDTSFCQNSQPIAYLKIEASNFNSRLSTMTPYLTDLRDQIPWKQRAVPVKCW